MAELVGGIAGSLQGTVNGVLNKGTAFLDKWFPPERRAELWARLQKFTSEKPMLASFLFSHIAISGLPLVLFFAMTITVGVFALLAALLLGLLGALVFVAVCVGFALIILLPTLFFTTLAASFVWLWGVGAYYLIKWFNQKEVPGIHTSLKDGLPGVASGGKSENDELPALNEKAVERAPMPERKDTDQDQKKDQGEKKSGKENGLPTKDVTDNVGKTTGVDVGNIGDLKKKANVGNVTDKADVGKVTDKANLGSVTDKADVGNVAKSLPVGSVTG